MTIMKQKTTEAQYRAILNFQNALQQLADEGVAIVRANDDDTLLFFNAADIRQFISCDDKDDYPEAVDITDYADDVQIGCIINHAYYPCDGERVLAVLNG